MLATQEENTPRGGEVVSRLAHNQETIGAIPIPATFLPEQKCPE